MSECTCGRSPTGKCVGWHGLSDAQYAEKRAIYEARQASKAQNILSETDGDLLVLQATDAE